jgi:hypothetical protein
MSMAAESPTPTARREHREGASTKPQILVIELEKRQTPKQVRRLRQGRGKLLGRIENILNELAEAGTVKSDAQPVVILVREEPPLLWPFS